MPHKETQECVCVPLWAFSLEMRIHGWGLPCEALRGAGEVESCICGFSKGRRVVGIELMMGTASVSAPLCQSDNVGLSVQPRNVVKHFLCKGMVALL